MKIADTKSSKNIVAPKPQTKSKNLDVIERTNSAPADPQETSIKNVWAENFQEEVYKIMKLLDRYVYVAVDIEFPGIIYESRPDLPYYYTIKRNVDDLKMIQVGFSLADEQGQKPPGTSTWQFNLQFDVNKDPHSQDSIEMLRKAGIDFERHATHGVDLQEFAQWLTVSNIPFNDDVKWICFSGCFDFAYMLKLLTNKPLPPSESEFHQELKIYFPCIYDVKSITKDIEDIKQGSLNRLIDDLEIKRDGTTHQGGSDSLVTLLAFFRIKDQFLRNHIDNYKFANVIYGLNGEDNSHKEYQMAYMPDPSLFADLSAAFIPQMGVLNYSPMNLNMMQLRYLQNFGVQKMPDMTNNFPPLMYASFSAFS